MADNYLREKQYKDSSNLAKRANLHIKYGRGDWFGWLAGQCDFADGQRVLDIGCGAGWFWSNARESLPADLEIKLADISPGMVEEALGRLEEAGRWKTYSGQVARIESLPFGDGDFDRALAFHMLYHAEDQRAAVREVARVLKPDGMAVFSTNGAMNMATADRLRQKAFGLPDEPVINFTLESGKSLLEQSFSQIEVRRNSSTMTVTEEADVFDYLTSFPPGDSASPEDLEALKAEIAAAFKKGAGSFDIPVETGVFICRH